MPIRVEQDDTGRRICLEGAIGIEYAVELKEVLVREFRSGSGLRLSLKGVSYLDVTAIQLLRAASREAKTTGVPFVFVELLPATVGNALAQAGMEDFLAPA